VPLGLLNPNGDEVLPTTVLELTEGRQSFHLSGHDATDPVDPARVFGAGDPGAQVSPEERAFLLAHDTDPFNKWEAGRALAKDLLVAAW
jgi:aminopeptidase N